MEQQVLDERYVDKPKLLDLLKRLFGAGKFGFEVNLV
jgi:hypothetical protein